MAIVNKYGGSLGALISDITDASLYCLNPENLSVSDYSLDLLSELVKNHVSKPQLTIGIQKVADLGNASFINEGTVEWILKFFTQLATNVKDLNYKDIIHDLQGKIVSIKTTLPAKIIATIVTVIPALYSAYIAEYDKTLTTGDNDKKLMSAIVIGEIGKRKDLSALKDIVKRIDKMFLDENAQIRQAASHCLGSISHGNVDFFFPKVLELIKQDIPHKYLLLVSINDIIVANRGKEFENINGLLDILFENANSEEENIRNVVAECLGWLFPDNGTVMVIELTDKFNSPSKNMLTTVGKALKYAVQKNNDVANLKEIVPNYLDLCRNEDMEVR